MITTIKNKIEQDKKKVRELEKQIERIDNKTMITIRIFGIIKQRITKIVEVPIDNTLSINKYLFEDKKLKEEWIKKVKEQFPKGSIINVEKIK